MFGDGDLAELGPADRRPAVSIYLPTHVAGREIRQDPIRFKNLLAAAEERLADGADGVLAPARGLLQDEDFWRHQEAGLGVFLAPGFVRVHRLPIAVPEEVAVETYFHIRPLLALAEPAAEFWLLALSARRARLFRGGRGGLEECREPALPPGVAGVSRESEYEETYSGPASARRGAAGFSQPLGDTPDETKKAALIEYLRRVAAAVEPIVKNRPLPVILAAHPQIAGNFRTLADWRALLPKGIGENPDALGEEDLRRRAAAMLAPAAAAHRGPVERLTRLIDTGDGKATRLLAEVVEAARFGRIDTLFLGVDGEAWGRFEETAQRAFVHAARREGDIELLNFAALFTLRHGGRVLVVEPADLPPSCAAAALLRY